MSPFNDARYKRLLEGLNVSEVALSKVLAAERCDAEFFHPHLIALEAKLGSMPHSALGESCQFVAGPFGSEFIVENYEEESGYRYIRGKDVKNVFLEDSDNVYIPKRDYDRLLAHALKANDVLVSVVGTLGNSCIILEENVPSIFSCKSTVIRHPKQNPWFLVAYLNSSIGQRLLLRNARGTVQLGLNLSDLRQLKVPDFGLHFQSRVESAVRNAHLALVESRRSFSNAELILLSKVGLTNWVQPEHLTYQRGIKEVIAAGRLDAEHFNPKYDALLQAMKDFGLNLVKLSEIILPVKNGFDVRDFYDEGTPYIRVGDIKKCRINLDSAARVLLRPDDIKKDIKLREGDVLFTRKGSFGNAAPVRSGEEHVIISSEIMLIRRNPEWEAKLLPEYLAMFFNSLAGNYQAEQWAHGVAFYSISQNDLNSFNIPLISMEQQCQIKIALDVAKQARGQAFNLIARAKRAVEIAIEDSEAAAFKYLEDI